MDSLVLFETPPSSFPAGLGRIYTFGSLTKFFILVLSPRILPLVIELEGSTAKTATFFSNLDKYVPKASIKVLFPTPGTPVIPILIEVFLFLDRHSFRILFASFLSLFFLLSISVIALLRDTVSPLRILFIRFF